MDLNVYPYPHDQSAFTTAENQAVIVLADTGEVTVLNEVATRVWELSNGEHNLGEVAQILSQEYEAEPEVIQGDVESFIQKMVDIGAIILLDKPVQK